MDSIGEQYRDVVITLIKYHAWWPSQDQFYRDNPSENAARINYYGWNAIPALVVDGATGDGGNYGALMSAIDARLLTPTPLEIAVSDTLIGDSVYVSAQVTAPGEVDSRATYTFQCVAVEWLRPYKQYYIMRDMVPDPAGEPFTISTGDTVTFDRVWYMNLAVYNPLKMSTTVFVQNDATKEVIQAASTNPPKEHQLYYAASGGSTILPPGGSAQFFSLAYNAGTVPDTFDMDMSSTLPGGWSASYTSSQGTFSGPSEIPLAPGQTDTVWVDVDPAGIPGFGLVEMSALYAPDSTVRVQTFNTIHDVDVLVVDDDGGEPFEAYFQAALDSAGVIHGTWDRSTGGLTLADIENSSADALVWMTGLAFPTFDDTDRAVLADYLDNGGLLFATGQDIGWSLCDLSSSWWSVDAVNWYQNYLGATYISDDTNDMTLVGVTSDPISDGMSLTITGGDGASNQGYPSEIQPRSTALPIFYYDAGMTREGGVRYDAGYFKTVYLAFGFEAIDNPVDRALLMGRILDWFASSPTEVEDGAIAHAPAWLAQNAPNPFNPQTEIRFSVPAKGHVRLDVYNVQGQRVRVLEDRVLEPGVHTVHWDGADEAGHAVASGLYLYSLTTGGFEAARKMILLR